jgi:hypothetical protein
MELDHDAIRASPILSGGILVVASDGGWLVGIDIGARAIAWERDVGAKMNADMAAEGGDVLIAPSGCVTPENGSEKVYYTKVNPLNGDLSFASGVC